MKNEMLNEEKNDIVIEDIEKFQEEMMETIDEVDENGQFKSNNKNRRAMKSIVKSCVRKAKVEYKVVTIGTWLEMYLEKVDHQPIGQRLPVDPTDDKSQSILFSLIEGDGIGQITMCDVKGHKIYKWESIDGGHRKRALRDFLRNKLPVVIDGVNVWFENVPKGEEGRAFTDQEWDDFMDIKISLQIFYGLTNEQKGKLFRKINDTSVVKEQEMLNSFGDIPAACFIRNMVRVVAGQNNVPHPLFAPDGNDIHRMKWLSESNKNLKQEEFLAKLTFRFWDKKLNKKETFLGAATTGKDSGDLMDMYNRMTLKEVKKISVDVKKVIGFLEHMAHATQGTRKTEKLTWQEQVSLTHFYLWMCDTFGKHSFKILDYQKFFHLFENAVDAYDKDIHIDKYGNPIIDKEWNDKYEKKVKTVSELFSVYQREFVQVPKIKKGVEWLVAEFDWNADDVFLELDKQRLFPVKMKELSLRRQGRVCYIDGLPLSYNEAEAAHIDAHCKGGYTIQKNIAMVRKCHNRAMGSMNLHKWMKRNGFENRVPANI